MSVQRRKLHPLSAEALDIEDINYETSSEELGVLNYRPHPRWRRGVLVGGAVFLAKALRALATTRHQALDSLAGARVLAVVASLNQYRALKPVLDHIDGARVLSLHPSVAGSPFPEGAAYFESLRYLPQVVSWMRRARGYRRLGYSLSFDRYWLSYGHYLLACQLLHQIGPRLLLVANDHSMPSRTFERAATGMGIATAYMQHASVSHGFPPLRFDLAFLDGLESAEKYDLPTAKPVRAFLTGIPRADTARLAARPRRLVRSVGLCVNTLDPIDKVREFVESFRRLAPDVDVLLRPHPSDRRPWRSALATAGFSDSHKEPPFEFLDRVDAIVTGPSGIALDAALVGVRPLFVDFAGTGRDHYGFIQRGLCEQVHDAAEAIAALSLRALDPHGRLMRDYCSTVSTPYDGRSAALVGELVEEYLSGGIGLGRWERVKSLQHLDAFELRG